MSDCNVCIGGYDFDGYIEMFEQKVIRARKEHKCNECRRVISKGAECERTSGKWEGEFSTDHTCMDCVNIREAFRCDEPMALGMLWADIDAVFGEVTTGCVARIETASAKAYFMERWRKWKGLE